MATCDICGNEFKNNSGLSGHKQLGHRYESGETSGLERYPERFLKPSEQRLLGLFEERLLEQIGPQLERLEHAALVIEQAKVAAVEAHNHGMSDPECPSCIELVRETLNTAEQKGRKEGSDAVLSIPGVREAVAFNNWANDRNTKARSSDFVANWFNAHGLSGAIGNYCKSAGGGVGEDFITIVSDEYQADAQSAEKLIRGDAQLAARSSANNGWAHNHP